LPSSLLQCDGAFHRPPASSSHGLMLALLGDLENAGELALNSVSSPAEYAQVLLN
jgi:hypothetical protein